MKKKTFDQCYQQAVRELKMPPRGPKGSQRNLVRQELGARVYRRAVELFKAQ